MKRRFIVYCFDIKKFRIKKFKIRADYNLRIFIRNLSECDNLIFITYKEIDYE